MRTINKVKLDAAIEQYKIFDEVYAKDDIRGSAALTKAMDICQEIESVGGPSWLCVADIVSSITRSGLASLLPPEEQEHSAEYVYKVFRLLGWEVA